MTLNLAYNPAGQIVTRTLSNPAYAYAPGTGNTAYVNNGRNQVASVNGAGVGYDTRQNIAAIPGVGGYGYNGSNELTTATVGGTTTGLSYDPGGRLYQSGSTRFLYDGEQVVGEYNTSGGLLRRYVPGLGLDTVITAYEGAGYDRRWLLSDERRSVVSITDGSANALTTNTYDEYGQPGSGNSGLFQYTGQMWLPEAQLYHYRARAYAPQLGRFMQTDPIGYQAGANVYVYVGADPVNMVDLTGLQQCIDVTRVTTWTRDGIIIKEERQLIDSYCLPEFSWMNDILDGSSLRESLGDAFSQENRRRFLCNVGKSGKLMNNVGGYMELFGAGSAAIGVAISPVPVVGQAGAAVLLPAGEVLYSSGVTASVVGAFGMGAGGDFKGAAIALLTSVIPARLGRGALGEWLGKLESTAISNGSQIGIPEQSPCPQ